MVTGDGTWYLVDLPGYGFANAPDDKKKQWALFTREYLLERENLLSVMLLIDSTVKPQQLDMECLDFLGENDIPVTIVFTKAGPAPLDCAYHVLFLYARSSSPKALTTSFLENVF